MTRWSISGKEVLITGANSGIGFETALALARQGATVTITARDPARGEAALERLRADSGRADISLRLLDLASFASVRACAAGLLAEDRPLHVLINNAGVALSERRITEDGQEATFQINHFGPFLLTGLLRERLRASEAARVISVASRAYLMAGARGIRFDDLLRNRRYRGFQVYGESKLANIYFIQELARRATGGTLSAFSLHPGVVATGFAGDGDMTGLQGIITRLALACALRPRHGARTSIHLATAPDIESHSGAFFYRRKPHGLRAIARDAAAAKRLWDYSEELTGITYGS